MRPVFVILAALGFGSAHAGSVGTAWDVARVYCPDEAAAISRSDEGFPMYLAPWPQTGEAMTDAQRAINRLQTWNAVKNETLRRFGRFSSDLQRAHHRNGNIADVPSKARQQALAALAALGECLEITSRDRALIAEHAEGSDFEDWVAERFKDMDSTSCTKFWEANRRLAVLDTADTEAVEGMFAIFRDTLGACKETYE